MTMAEESFSEVNASEHVLLFLSVLIQFSLLIAGIRTLVAVGGRTLMLLSLMGMKTHLTDL